jgi:hypothetical protein
LGASRPFGPQVGPRPQEVVGCAQHPPGTLVIEPEAALAGGRELDGELRDGGRRVRDRQATRREFEKVSKDDWTDELMTEAAQLEERHNEIDEMADGLVVYAEEDRARAVCIVTIGDNGGSLSTRVSSTARRLRGRGSSRLDPRPTMR